MGASSSIHTYSIDNRWSVHDSGSSIVDTSSTYIHNYIIDNRWSVHDSGSSIVGALRLLAKLEALRADFVRLIPIHRMILCNELIASSL